jgi:hypothetical protein
LIGFGGFPEAVVVLAVEDSAAPVGGIVNVAFVGLKKSTSKSAREAVRPFSPSSGRARTSRSASRGLDWSGSVAGWSEVLVVMEVDGLLLLNRNMGSSSAMSSSSSRSLFFSPPAPAPEDDDAGA